MRLKEQEEEQVSNSWMDERMYFFHRGQMKLHWTQPVKAQTKD